MESFSAGDETVGMQKTDTTITKHDSIVIEANLLYFFIFFLRKTSYIYIMGKYSMIEQ
ncbi:hypothetical protein QY97_00159 [Bacillus thermotolerans]|uniref:Uncharacterized protein n=1 Tax=Bacillus thermotolerans TaxID=1221996 RepID=A0A0F5I276_BACTR|nr:hypothetical protein QY97_00159 [Bacillus thermotolerans]KKB42273.1 hypothetical protein QY95_00122 [Bacillus thermotolerans]KKB43921.1 hypothetical protein QY96_00327 [Bacillus thermotolerans]